MVIMQNSQALRCAKRCGTMLSVFVMEGALYVIERLSLRFLEDKANVGSYAFRW